MTLQEFIAKYNGKKVDFDGKFGAQCMDLYRFYLQEVWQKPQTPAVASAYMVFDTIDSNEYDKFTHGELKVGDVVVWNQHFGPDGHIAIVENPSDPTSIVVFGQNDPLGAVSKLSRHTYANILGWFRPKNPVAKTFMAITVVANKNTWSNLPAKLQELKQMFITASNNKFEPVFDIKQSNFNPIPLAPFLGQEGTKSVDVNWYRQNITPLATGQATLFLMNEADYNNGLTWGFMTYGDPRRPVRIEVSAKQDGADQFVERSFHEISHCLQFLTGQPDRTHELLYQATPQLQTLMDYIDQKKLQEQLVLIH